MPDRLPPVARGQRVFTCAHSFHHFVPPILEDMAGRAGIRGHETVGLSLIGGSRVIQHWEVPTETNMARKVLVDGKADVLTLSPIYLPDQGIGNFARLALAHHPEVRVTVQEFWLPNDTWDPTYPLKTKIPVDHNATNGAELRKQHAPYFEGMDALVCELNRQLGRETVFVVPVGQAVIALREKIMTGQAPVLKTQAELFTDSWGHPSLPLKVLAAWCHFAVIYRRNPVGLPLPEVLETAGNPYRDERLARFVKRPHDGLLWSNARVYQDEAMNRLFQELAWDAAVHHPLSGVR